jgi:hypothetical protein
MLGEELASCSLIELNQLESQAERGLRRIRARKVVIARCHLFQYEDGVIFFLMFKSNSMIDNFCFLFGIIFDIVLFGILDRNIGG